MPQVTVSLPSWSGPLDLLLELIRQAQVNIYDIPIREITRQYLETIALMQKLDVEVASEFLVMAATLVQLKSRMILPAELQEGEGELWEDPRRELVRQLLEYQKFKELAQELDRREALANRLLERREQPVAFTTSRGGASDIWRDITLDELLRIFNEVVRVLDFEEFGVLREEEYHIEDKLEYIRACLAERGQIEFFELFGPRKSRAELIVTFWAVLELYKLGAIAVRQQDFFGPILLFPRDLRAGLPGSDQLVAEAEAAEADLSDAGPAPGVAERDEETEDDDTPDG